MPARGLTTNLLPQRLQTHSAFSLLFTPVTSNDAPMVITPVAILAAENFFPLTPASSVFLLPQNGHGGTGSVGSLLIGATGAGPAPDCEVIGAVQPQLRQTPF
jgi:hypothetical protein